MFTHSSNNWQIVNDEETDTVTKFGLLFEDHLSLEAAFRGWKIDHVAIYFGLDVLLKEIDLTEEIKEELTLYIPYTGYTIFFTNELYKDISSHVELNGLGMFPGHIAEGGDSAWLNLPDGGFNHTCKKWPSLPIMNGYASLDHKLKLPRPDIRPVTITTGPENDLRGLLIPGRGLEIRTKIPASRYKYKPTAHVNSVRLSEESLTLNILRTVLDILFKNTYGPYNSPQNFLAVPATQPTTDRDDSGSEEETLLGAESCDGYHSDDFEAHVDD